MTTRQGSFAGFRMLLLPTGYDLLVSTHSPSNNQWSSSGAGAQPKGPVNTIGTEAVRIRRVVVVEVAIVVHVPDVAGVVRR